MKKQTQILNIFHTSGFISDQNKDGKKININHEYLFRILPSDPLTNIIASLRGEIRVEPFYTSLFLPLDFTVHPNDPAQNTVDLSITTHLPQAFIFFIHCLDPEILRYSGLNFNHRLLFLTAANNAVNYTYEGRSINCKPCGNSNIVGAADLTDTISSEASLDEIRRLTGVPLGLNDRILDLKVVVGTDEFIISNHDDLKALHRSLMPKAFTQMHIVFKRESDSSLIKDFPALFITKGTLQPGVIGVIKIPFASIDLTRKTHADFAGINHFIIHFPSTKAKLDLTIGTKEFDGGHKLFVDGVEVQAPVVVNHPDMANYKLVSGSINDYELILRKPKQVRIEKGTAKKIIPINPITTYDPLTKKALVNILN